MSTLERRREEPRRSALSVILTSIWLSELYGVTAQCLFVDELTYMRGYQELRAMTIDGRDCSDCVLCSEEAANGGFHNYLVAGIPVVPL